MEINKFVKLAKYGVHIVIGSEQKAKQIVKLLGDSNPMIIGIYGFMSDNIISDPPAKNMTYVFVNPSDNLLKSDFIRELMINGRHMMSTLIIVCEKHMPTINPDMRANVNTIFVSKLLDDLHISQKINDQFNRSSLDLLESDWLIYDIDF